MEVYLRPLVSWSFTNKNHQVDNVICLMIVVCKTSWNQRSQINFHGIEYINLIFIYLSSLYNSSISDIEHSPNYIALGLPQTHKVNLWQPTRLQYIYIYIYMCVCVCVCLLSIPDDIPDILSVLAPDNSTVKHVTELKFIIRPIYLGWLVRNDRPVNSH